MNMAGIAITKKAKARKAEWERVCNLSKDQLNAEYLEKGRKAWDQTWDLLHEMQGWKQENTKEGKSPTADTAPAPNGHAVVYSRQIQDLGKVFRVEAELDMDPVSLFNLMVKQSHDTPTWNPTIIESKVVYEIDDNTDLAYYITAEAAKGAVDCRDFVNIRHWETRDNIILSAGVSVLHPDFPPVRKFVRGENRQGGGMAFKPVDGQPDKCRFIWIINSDLKGLLPDRLVEAAIPEVCMETVDHAKRNLSSCKLTTNGAEK